MNRSTHRALALLLSLAAMIFMSLTVAGPAKAAPPAADPVSVPVAGTAELTDGTVGTVTGTLDIERFANQGGTLMAIGEFDGQITDAAGTVVEEGTQSLALPVNVAESSCEVLSLDLGPLDLNLLGLQVDLAPVVLDITAQQGAGNLLGNLLCAVAGLLDGPGAGGILNGVTALLNRILGALG